MAEFVSYGHICLISKLEQMKGSTVSYINTYAQFCICLFVAAGTYNSSQGNYFCRLHRSQAWTCSTFPSDTEGQSELLSLQTHPLYLNILYQPLMDTWLGGSVWHCVQNACCRVVTGSFLATCSTHQLVFCGASSDGSMQQLSLESF
jgi:hypothetical protein